MNNLPVTFDKEYFKEHATPFFELLFADALREKKGDIHICTFTPTYNSFYESVEEAVIGASKLWRYGKGVYFGVNPRMGRQSLKENIHYVTSFHSEVDYGELGHNKPSKYKTYEEALQAIENLEINPTHVNHSGGGFHMYWVLNSALEVAQFGLEKLEGINRGLGRMIGGDDVQNINRVLRVPGTYNLKDVAKPRKVEVVSTGGPKYDLGELEKYDEKPSQKNEKASTPVPVPIKISTPMNTTSPVKGNIPEKIQELIQNGKRLGDPYPSRSEADMAVISVLVKRGYSFDEIKEIFQNERIGDKYRTHNSPDEYLKHTIEEAKKFSALTDQELVNPLFISEAITKGNDKCTLNVLRFQEYIAGKHNLLFHEQETVFYLYNGKCYEPVNENQLDSICQSELGPYRYLFKTPVLNEFIHFCRGGRKVNSHKALDHLTRYLTFQNGLYDLTTHRLINHSPWIFTTNLLPYEFDEHAQCPRFEKYLEEIFISDKEVITFVQEAVGYAFHKSIPTPAVFFLIGNGSNGKSVFINTLTELIGEANASTISLDKFDRECYLVDLHGKMINVSTENPRNRQFSNHTFKAVVGGDWVTGKTLFKNPVKFRPFAKHYLAMNEAPMIDDNSHGMMRRLYFIDFPRQFNEGDADVNLPEKLKSELSGIFNWAMEGYKRLKARKFVFSKSRAMKTSKEKYRQQMDSASAFIAEKMIREKEASVRWGEVFEEYTKFCSSEGHTDIRKKTELKSLLEREGYKIWRSTKDGNQYHVFGARLS